MKICLIESPYLDMYGKSRIAISPYFPLGLGYIASSLEKAGHDVQMLVHSGEQDFLRLVLDEVKAFQPGVIGISSMTPNFPNAIEIAAACKKASPAPIVIGGHHVSVFRERVLKEFREFDFVVYGEGEDVMVSLVHSLDQGEREFWGVRGIVWRRGGEVVLNLRSPLREDLDGIPFPARDKVDMGRFSTHSHIGGGNSATILTTRGCPFECTFCSAHLVDGRRYREHSIAYVIAEIRELVVRYGVKYVFIQDDTFTLKKKRVQQFCNELIASGLDITFGCFSRVDIMDEEMAILLKQAGCRNVIFGIESGDDAILKMIKKKASRQKAFEAVQTCNKHGIKTTASFIVGFPTETRKSIMGTLEFAIELNPSIAVFNPLVPFPGSEMFNEEMHAPSDVAGWRRFLTVDVPPFSFVEGMSPHEVYRLSQECNRKFYLRFPKLLRLAGGIRSIGDFREYVRAGIGLLMR